MSIVIYGYSKWSFAAISDAVRIALPPSGTQAPVLLNGSVGRLWFDISCSQLEHLVQAHFSCPQMASILGLSVSSIRRRMQEYDLTIVSTYSSIIDAQLDEMVAGARSAVPPNRAAQPTRRQQVFSPHLPDEPNQVDIRHTTTELPSTTELPYPLSSNKSISSPFPCTDTIPIKLRG